ncbi:MAG: VOC family protein [Gammaproteobacteria bacterium]|nr:VOC family protein [Gammaproteobacteria bacterium]
MLLPVLLAALAGCTPPGAEGDESSSSTAATADTLAIQPLGLVEAPDPLTLRRQTLIVRDIEKSLLLYRDAIGMEVIYDNIIRRPHRTEDRQQEIRLVFLKANNDFIGVLGLVDYEYNNPDHPAHAKPVRKEGFTPGNSVLLFNTTQLEERWPKIEAVEGVDVIGGPTYTEYPSYDGSSIIRVNVTRFYDADGFLVEFNQPLDPIH